MHLKSSIKGAEYTVSPSYGEPANGPTRTDKQPVLRTIRSPGPDLEERQRREVFQASLTARQHYTMVTTESDSDSR